MIKVRHISIKLIILSNNVHFARHALFNLTAKQMRRHVNVTSDNTIEGFDIECMS